MKRSWTGIVVWSVVGVVWGADIVGYTMLDGAPKPKKKIVHPTPAQTKDDEQQAKETPEVVAHEGLELVIHSSGGGAVFNVPEPASLGILGLGAGPFLLRRRHKN